MANHLQSALDALLAEREVIGERQRKLTVRLTAVEQGIASLSALLDTEEPITDVLLPTFPDLTELPLWAIIETLLQTHGPMKVRDIAEQILSHGYETSSRDFPNVVGTNLRAYPNKFQKLEDGRWMNSIA